MHDIPNNLLRRLGKEEYALSFLEGKIHFGLLDCYRTIEDSRRDSDEGRASFYWDVKAPELIFDRASGEEIGRRESDQNIHFSGTSINRYYVLCTSDPEARGPTIEKFGPFVVRINDPL